MSVRVIWQRLRRFRAMSGREQRLFLRAAALLPSLSMSLRIVGFVRTQQTLQFLLRGETSGGLPAEERAIRVAATVRMVHAAAQYGVGRPTCLERSLALWWLLGHQGIAAQLRIGARKVREKFEAHAWVECGGVAVSEPDEPHRHFEAFEAAFPNGIPEPQ